MWNEPQPDHEVVVIGAGLGGLGMGIALRRAGIEDFVILERADDIGGTWRDNTYPGIAVDVPAQAYQFSFDLNPDWSRAFAPGHEVKDYIDRLAARHELRPHLRLNSEVTRRTWDDDAHLWRLEVNGAELLARHVVSAIGAFVEPKPVDIPGVDRFTGKLLRSASWDHDYDLAGKRLAVVGTGASAVQIVPEVADVVDHLDVYQRTPIWVAPKVDPRTGPSTRVLFRRFPAAQQLVRRLSTRQVEAMLVDMVVNHHRFPYGPQAVAWLLANGWYRRQVQDPEVRRKLTPDYGFGCKRPSVSNTYLSTFNRSHVDLVTDPIEEIVPEGIRAGGCVREVDAIVLATGFRLASDPAVYRRTPVTGRDGFDLATHYAEQRLGSYESISLPKLPNHFMIFGPYGWTGGTWHQLVEIASEHIVRVILEARRRGATAVEVTPEAADDWTEEMRRRMEGSLFQNNYCGPARSYYFDHHGDTPFLRPTSSSAARRAARTFPFEHYRFSSQGVTTAP
jgi:cation diffusion facilitator CzcD-associated flavoprotein CzcO